MSTEANEPPSSHWADVKTRYLPGDLVKTELGLAIITEAAQPPNEQYSVWMLPGWKWRRIGAGCFAPKAAWYYPEELELVEAGPATRLRPNQPGN